MREAYDLERFSERFYDVSFRCICDLYGTIEPSDFNSQSAMRGFFTHRQNLIHDCIQKQSGSGLTAIGFSAAAFFDRTA